MKSPLTTIGMLLFACLPAFALAQTSESWPARPVKLILPFAAGTSSDIAARVLSEPLAQVLGQPVLVESRTGAGQNIGTAAVVNAAPDGYTFLFASDVIVVEHLLDKSVSFVVQRDLTPVARVVGGGQMLVVPEDFPAKTLKDFVAQVKANPGKYNYVTVNNFELPDLVFFRDRLGLNMVSVPFKSGPEAMQAIASDTGHLFSAAVDTFRVFKGKARSIAYTGQKPHPLFPNIPTVMNSGVGMDDYEAGFAYATFYPAKTPQVIVQKLHTATVSVLTRPEVVKRFTDFGYETPYSDSIPQIQAGLSAKVKRVEEMVSRGLKLR